MSDLVLQGRYYVYVHRYPVGYIDEDGTDLSSIVFYVGKGTANDVSMARIDQHEAEARRGIQSRKCDVIRKIWMRGLEVDKEIVYTTNIETDALTHEVELITLYSTAYLTNVRDCSTAGAISERRVESKLRQVRMETGLSIDQLAMCANVSPRTIQRVEKGQRSMLWLPAKRLLAALSEKLGRTITAEDIGISIDDGDRSAISLAERRQAAQAYIDGLTVR
ncbi:MAG TPA: helix-turn-helix domain-containing protein [Ktedonobacteraceae bacterium]|nr:helix-turn-helix domain-containing protein [Ktedonobacteraceae bacterium]